MKQYFAFHNPTKVQHQNLSPEEMKQKILEDTNLSNWLIWQPGMTEWKPASEIPEIQEMAKVATVPPPLPMPPPLPPELKIEAEEVKKLDSDSIVVEFSNVETKPPVQIPAEKPKEFSVEKATTETKPQEPAASAPQGSSSNLRQHPRIKGRLRTIITNKERAFITYTRDISLGGVYLEHAIPEELLKGSVDIFITGPTGKDSIVFRCTPVQNQEGYYRFSFSLADQKNHHKLGAWLDELAKGAKKA